MAISWKEFKDYVDGKLKEKNIAESDIQIDYIDISFPSETSLLSFSNSVERDKQMYLSVTN